MINVSDQTFSLVYHTGGLGDFLTTLPALKKWNAQNQSCKKILLGKPSYGILGVHAGLFDEIWDVESAAFSWLYNIESPAHPSIKDKLFAIQSALLFTSESSPVLARFRALGIKKIVFQDPFPKERMHIGDYHLSLFNKTSITDSCTAAKLHPHPEYKNEADRLLEGIGKFAALHPVSGSKIKNWPYERFVELAELLLKKGLDCVWIFGPSEEEIPVTKTGRVIRNASLPALVHVLSRCGLYIGNDSGISHLAAACGAPSVVLFGPSDPAVWKPQGKHVSIVFKNRAACFPCHPLAGSGLKNKDAQAACKEPCMSGISVEEVFDACKKVIKRERG